MATELFLENAAVKITRETSAFGPQYFDYTFKFATGEKKMQIVFKNEAEEKALRSFAAAALHAYELDRAANRKIISIGKDH